MLRFNRTVVTVVVLAVMSLVLVACSPTAVTPTFVDGYMKAMPALTGTTSMTAVFGVITNPGSADIQLIKATNTTAGLTETPLEIHEMVMKNGSMVMQPISGGVNIPAHGSTALKPGGYHVMYLNLLQPIPVGSTVTLTLEFSNGAKVPISVVARDLANAQENYTPSASPSPSMSMSH